MIESICVYVCDLASLSHGHTASLSTWVSKSEDSGNPKALSPAFLQIGALGSLVPSPYREPVVRHPVLVSEPRETWAQPWEVCLGETNMFPLALPLLCSVADSVCTSWEWEFHQNSAHPGTSVLWWSQKVSYFILQALLQGCFLFQILQLRWMGFLNCPLSGVLVI